MAARWSSHRSTSRRTATSTGQPTFAASSCRLVIRPLINADERGFYLCSSALDLRLKISYYLRLVALWKNYMHRRERWYHQRDNNRLVRPFEWGLEYIVEHVNGDRSEELFRDRKST